MGKRKVASPRSSENKNEKSNIPQNSPKKQINHLNQLLLQTANMTSKKQFLQRGLKNSDVQHILNKINSGDEKTKSLNYSSKRNSFQDENSSSSSNEDQDNMKHVTPETKINIKEEKFKKHDVSSSYESSEDEPFLFKVKKDEKKSKTDNGDPSEDSESDSSDPGKGKKTSKHRVKPVLQNIKEKDSTNSESESDSEPNNEENKLIQTQMKIKKRESSTSESESESVSDSERMSYKQIQQKIKKKESSSSESESESVSDRDKRNYVQIQQKIKKKESSNSESESESSGSDGKKNYKQIQQKNSKKEPSNSEIMEKIERALKDRKSKDKSSESDSDALTKSRVKILQNVRLDPQIKDSKELLKMRYPGIEQTKSNIELNCSGSKDLYLLRIPKNVDPDLLLNAEFDFKNEFKINIGDKYNVKPTTKIPDPTLVVSNSCRVIHFKSNFIMEKHIKSKKEPKIVVPEKKTVPLPDNLKNRHPLFGPNFQVKINLSETVEKKLDEAIANMLRKEEKAKKKKHKKRKAEQGDSKIFEMLNSHNSVKRIDKGTSEDSAFSSSGSIDKISKKNKKSRQTLLAELLKDIKTEYDSESPENKSPKKKKRHSIMEHDWEEKPQAKIKKEIDVASIKTEVDGITLSKREKKRLSLANSTLFSDIYKIPPFNPELSEIHLGASTSEKKNKKVKRKKEDDASNKSLIENKAISDILEDLKDNLLLPPKAKKKKKHKELDN